MVQKKSQRLLDRLVVSDRTAKKVAIIRLREEINEVLDAGISMVQLHEDLTNRKQIDCKYDWFRTVVNKMRNEQKIKPSNDENTPEKETVVEAAKPSENVAKKQTILPAKKGDKGRTKKEQVGGSFEYDPLGKPEDLI